MTTFTITRVFDAPRPLVFECWTNPEHVAKWFTPPGCTSEVLHTDIRPGGYNIACITAPDGTKAHGKHSFREISPVERLVFVNSSVDEDGNPIRHPFAPEWPMELLTTVTFVEMGNKTELTLTWVPIDASVDEDAAFEKGLDGCHYGWSGTFDQLASYMKSVL